MGFQSTKTHILRRAVKHHTPVIGEFELTSGCNFACAMCYVHDESSKKKDMDTRTWKRIFDEAADAGLLFGVLTGGEPLSRPDFNELYGHLHDLGVRVTLFTNGALLNETHMALFAKRPPESVVITLYGPDQATYGKVTRVPGGFRAVNNGLDLLAAHDIPHRVRTLPLNVIHDRLDAMIAFAKERDLVLEHTRYVTPFPGGDIRRLKPDEAMNFDRRLREAFPRMQPSVIEEKEADGDASCLAARAAYFINHAGRMQPCSLAYRPAVDVKEQTVKEAFDELRSMFRDVRRASVCAFCAHRDDCLSCYARRLQEEGPDECADYLLKMAEASEKPQS